MKPASEGVKEIESPSGLDLNPEPPSPTRLSKRAGIAVLFVVSVLVALVGYGIMNRNNRGLDTVFHPDESKGLTAATDAGKVIVAQIPNRSAVAGVADRPATQPDELRPPGSGTGRQAADTQGQRTY